jgi:hypothetical protein
MEKQIAMTGWYVDVRVAPTAATIQGTGVPAAGRDAFRLRGLAGGASRLGTPLFTTDSVPRAHRV